MSALRTIAVAVAVVGIVAACQSSATPGPAAPSSPSSAAPSAAAPSPSVSGAPSTPPATPTPSPVATPTPAPSLSTADLALVAFLRADVRVGCVPRRTDLPPRATLGVECHPADPLVAAVGIYSFGSGLDPEPARDTYLERLAAASVKPASGDCAKGTPGDHAWPANLEDQGDDGGLSPLRSGCFLDVNGIANVRATCYGDLYVGVLGNTKELANLYAWTWKVAQGEDTHRDPPGICAAPD
ncbi:MAG TPA: hypothetical protein VGJ71_08100 [Candidatus Limnocylindrales bacterium]